MATKISTILDRIDNGSLALPVFQRGYVWTRKQVSELFNSLYKDYPVGSLLIWETASPDVQTRGETPASSTHRQILLDGQQRMTSLYGVIRGREPAFFNGNAHAFQNLRFHLEEEVFEFFQPVKMQNNPLWIDVTELYSKGGMESIVENLKAHNIDTSNYIVCLMKLLNIAERDLYIDSVTGEDKTIEEVVNIFDRVNSAGTKLTRGDLALAKICSEWSEAREVMQSKLLKWKNMGYDFNLDWLLRITNVMITGRGLFVHLHNVTTSQVQDGLMRAEKNIDKALNMISNRLGLDHNQVLYAKLAFPVIVAFLNKQGDDLSPEQRDKILYWYTHAGMWGRYAGSPESTIETDLSILQDTSSTNDPIDQLLKELDRWRGGLKVGARNFHGSTRGNRFYSVLYMMTRMGEARDLYDDQPLNRQLEEKPQLELHHIFPKSLLQRAGYDAKSRNALANFCFLTKESAQKIRSRAPVEYLEEIAEKYPGALESQWIPMNRSLWEIHKYDSFLDARKRLLAEGANLLLNNLRTDHTKALPEKGWDRPITSPPRPASIADDEEEAILLEINQWMKNQNLPTGILGYEIANPDTGEEVAMFDLAWPEGVQSELSEPVAVLIDEDVEVLAVAGKNGYRFFTSPEGFKQYINEEILMSSNGNRIQEIIQKGESETIEFKSSLRMNLHINEKDPRLEHSVIKTLAGFLNREGGTLLIGVADDGTSLGIKTDKFKSEDKMTLHLVELIKSRMGHTAVTMIHIDYETYQDNRIMRVVCDPSPSPVYVKDGNDEHLYVRMGPSTDKLPTSKIQEYIKHRFTNKRHLRKASFDDTP